MSVNSISQSRKKPYPIARRIAIGGVLGALAIILTFFKIPLPFMPSFIKLDFTDLPALIGAIAIGPLGGAAVSVVKVLENLLIDGTTTGGIGELSNLLLSLSLVVPAGFIYKIKPNRKMMCVACVSGAVIMAALSFPINYFVVYPMYTKFMPMETIINMYKAINPSITSLWQALLVFNVPFTFCKGISCAILCFLVYKPIEKFVK